MKAKLQKPKREVNCIKNYYPAFLFLRFLKNFESQDKFSKRDEASLASKAECVTDKASRIFLFIFHVITIFYAQVLYKCKHK